MGRHLLFFLVRALMQLLCWLLFVKGALEGVIDSQEVQLQTLKKNGGLFFPRDDHMQYHVCWNLSYLNEEQMHSCVSEIKLEKKKSGFYVQAVT